MVEFPLRDPDELRDFLHASQDFARKVIHVCAFRVIATAIIPTTRFDCICSKMESRNRRDPDCLAHLFLIYFPSLFYEVAEGEPITYDTEWEDRLPYIKLGFSGITRYGLIDLTDLKQRIDEELGRA